MSTFRQGLLQRQQQLVERIFAFIEPHRSIAPDTHQGIRIYQNNLLMTATRALSITYPVIEKMVGKQTLTALAKLLLHRDPPDSGDWAEWGESLAELLTTTELVQQAPYLFDMAQLEWKIHQVSRCPEQAVNLATLSRLTDYDLARVYIRLSPAIALQHSNYPIDALWRAHQTRNDYFQINQRELKKAIQQHQGACLLLIYQQHQVAQLKRVTPQEYRWLQDILAGYSIAELLDQHPEFDFVAWFSSAIQENWIEQLTITRPHEGDQS